MEKEKYICTNKEYCPLQKGGRKRVGFKCVESNCEYLVKTINEQLKQKDE